MKRTPGPWHVNDDKCGRYIETSDDVIAQVFRDGRGNFDADACLIAAAPELLATLIEAERVLECCRYSEKPMAEKCRVIIAKAAGKS